jgi:hypothetical protein
MDRPTVIPASKALQDCCVVTYCWVTMEMKSTSRCIATDMCWLMLMWEVSSHIVLSSSEPFTFYIVLLSSEPFTFYNVSNCNHNECNACALSPPSKLLTSYLLWVIKGFPSSLTTLIFTRLLARHLLFAEQEHVTKHVLKLLSGLAITFLLPQWHYLRSVHLLHINYNPSLLNHNIT